MKITEEKLKEDKKAILLKADRLREQIEGEARILQGQVDRFADVERYTIPNIKRLQTSVAKLNKSISDLAYLDGGLAMIEEFEYELKPETT